MNSSKDSKSLSTAGPAGLPNFAYLANFTDIAFDAIVAFDSQEQVTFWNPAAERMYG
jgi:PAS domain-containing protein